MIDKELIGWEDCIEASVFDDTAKLQVLISENGKVIFKNPAFRKAVPHFSINNLINPTFEKIKNLPYIKQNLIFEDMLTLGTITSGLNQSYQTFIFKKYNQYLIVAQQSNNKLIEQNRKLRELLRENTDLQRQLLRTRKKQENTLAEFDNLNNELKKQIQTKDKIFSIISHDIRSPFSGIMGISELLYENFSELSNDEMYKFVTHLNNASLSYYSLIINLLEWASLQQKKYSFLPQKHNIHELFNNVYTSLIENANQKQLLIEKNIPKDLIFKVDAHMFSGIVRNLLSNAIKFTPVNGTVTINATVSKHKLSFSITDSGIGLSQEKIEGILKNQLVKSTPGTNNEKGTGLGLSLCKELIEIHRGQLSIESEINKGSCFRFVLPASYS